MLQRYAVIDIETTGGMPKRDKITEIGIVIFDGTSILEQYSSLVNPERSIPPSITRITGITDSMVADAPKFYEIAKRIVELTEGCIFVAHNVRFDYQFIQEEFRSLGFTFSRRKLCTVVLSRKAFPELKSHSLGNLIAHFGIKVKDRHRALDDAYAASEVLRLAMQSFGTKKDIKSFISASIKQTQLPKNLTIEDIEGLPTACGVYYFKDTDDNIIYVGKSLNIQQRVKQHFGKEGKKANRLFREVAYIEHTVTGSELLSLLHESEEIKKHRPSINVAQKTIAYPFTITSYYNEQGYLCLKIHTKGELAPPNQNEYGNFSSRQSAKSRLHYLAGQFELCKQLCDLESSSNATCFNYGVGKCLGACLSLEEINTYNERCEMAINTLDTLWKENFLIVEYTQNIHERVIFSIVDGIYTGYSIYSPDRDTDPPAYIHQNPDKLSKFNPENQSIIQNYLLSKTTIQIIEI